MLSFKLTGAGGVTKEYKAFNTKFYTAVQAGLTAVGSELTKHLQEHIRKDVYDAYTPKSYPRRSGHPQFGTPLESPQNMDLQVNKLSLIFSYEPTGDHSGTKKDRLDWSALKKKYQTAPNQPIKPNPVHGDDLIRRIETGEGYDWDVAVPERHFWNNFVEEAVGAGGWTEKVLVKAMNTADNTLGAISDGRVTQDGNDTLFEQQISIDDDIVVRPPDDDGDLPY